jgi:hypothetical protein
MSPITRKAKLALAGTLVSAILIAAFLYLKSPAADPEAQKQVVLKLFETGNCAECHGFTQAGAFGVNRQGAALGRGFEGCGPMLDVIKETLARNESEWTQKHKTARMNFGRFGCDSCHQLGAKSVELTSIGRAAGDILHRGCVDMCCPKEPIS